MRGARLRGPRVAPGSGRQATRKLSLRRPLPARSEHYTMVAAEAAAGSGGGSGRRAEGAPWPSERQLVLQHSPCRSDVRPASLPRAPGPGSAGPALPSRPRPRRPRPRPLPRRSRPLPRRSREARWMPSGAPAARGAGRGSGRARETPGGSAAHGCLSGRRALSSLKA